MPGIGIIDFSGQSPRTEPSLLGNGQAAKAMNCRLFSGAVKSYNTPFNLQKPVLPEYIKTLFLYEEEYWFQWTTDVTVVRSPIVNDPNKRVYFTGDGIPKLTTFALATTGSEGVYPIQSRPLGVSRPSGALTATRAGSGGSGLDRSIVYIYTYITDLGEEGAPCLASNLVSAELGEEVNLSGFAGAGSDFTFVVKYRIYRSMTSASGTTEFQFVKDVSAGTSSTSDDVVDSSLGEVIPSTDWDMPPADLQGLISLPGGMLAGFSGNNVCICEPYQPHAWPPAYQYALDYPAVGLGFYGTTLVALTQAFPYLLSGTTPDNRLQEKLPTRQPCISANGIVSAEMGVFFPTPEGLYAIGYDGMNLVSRPVMTEHDWANYAPNTIRAALHEGCYYGFYRTDVTDTGDIVGAGFMFNPNEPASMFTELDFYAHAIHAEPLNDDLYFVLRALGVNSINQWDAGGQRKPYAWWSKWFDSSPVNYAAARVEATFNAGLTAAEIAALVAENAVQVAANAAMIALPPLGGAIGDAEFGLYDVAGDELTTPVSTDAAPLYVDFSLYVDDVLRFTQRVTDANPFRLPGGYKGRKTQIEISGTTDVRKVLVATSVAALAE